MGLEYLPKAIGAYKKAVKKNIVDVIGNKVVVVSGDTSINKAVDNFFRQAWEDNTIISELYDE